MFCELQVSCLLVAHNRHCCCVVYCHLGWGLGWAQGTMY